MKGKGFGRKQYYLDVMEYTTRSVSYDSRRPDRDSKRELPEFISEAMRLLASFCFSYKMHM
jgi:hypothetical protein